MIDNNPALLGDDSTPEGTATLDDTNPSDDLQPEGGNDIAAGAADDDNTDPNDGIHPDALDLESEDEPDLTDDEMKDSSRLKDRFKTLTSKARRAKDLETQNAELLRQVAEARKGTKPNEAPAPDDSEFTQAQLSQAKKLMDKLGYMPKTEVDSLKTAIKQLATERVTERDQKAMKEALNQYKDENGQPIVTDKHIQNAMRKWMQSDDPAIRNRVNMDYGAMIQLIGGSKLYGKVVKKPAAPKVEGGKGGAEAPFKPEDRSDTRWDPSDPIGSQERSLSRILSAIS